MPLRTAIIGCGAVANLIYLPALREATEIHLVAVSDLNSQNAAPLLKEFPGTVFFADYERMLAEAKPDAVIVALPHFLHKAASIKAMRLGADVFCEKPMAMNSAECDEIESVISETGRIFAVNFFRRLFPSAAAIKRMVETRSLGAPVSFDIAEGGPYGWPAMSDSFFDRKLAGGGVLMDSGVHTLDLLQWWLGEIRVVDFLDDAVPEGVECDCVARLTAGSAQGYLRMSRSVALSNIYRLEFEHGWIEWDHDDGSAFRFSVAGGETLHVEVQCDPRWAGGSRYTYALVEQLRNFAGACGREPSGPIVEAAEGRHSVDTIERCYADRGPLVLT